MEVLKDVVKKGSMDRTTFAPRARISDRMRPAARPRVSSPEQAWPGSAVAYTSRIASSGVFAMPCTACCVCGV